jgi:hypothetical protein
LGDTNTGQPKDYDDGAGGPQGSSYVNNFVTPIQRRTNFPEYVMEMCPKPLVSQCQPGDWFTGNLDVGADDDTKASALLGSIPTNGLRAGTTVLLPGNPQDAGYPRRVAFERDANNKLVLDADSRPIPIGIGGGSIARYPYAGDTPPIANNALWFKTTTTRNTPAALAGSTYSNQQTRPLFYTTALQATTQQPLLVPVLQLHAPSVLINAPQTSFPSSTVVDGESSTWMQTPDPTTTNRPTTFNLIIAAGDNPTRDTVGGLPPEFNGGMPNFPNFLENWGNTIPARISGSFIQFKRSSYATAPMCLSCNLNLPA